MTYLDTHVAAWLYAGRTDLVPAPTLARIEAGPLLVSPMVVLELQYLHELERVAEPASTVIAALGRDLGLRVCDLPFERVVAAALEGDWTRDPFDRLIVSQAAVRPAPLVTKDRTIHARYPAAVW